MRRSFSNGTLQQELVQSYVTADIVVLATIERVRVESGGLPSQDWALRVTWSIDASEQAGSWCTGTPTPLSGA